MVRRLLRFGVLALIVALGLVSPTLAVATATPASADTVVDGCTIVSSPTATNFTNCPGLDLMGADLSGADLSFADLAGARFAKCDFFTVTCGSADLDGGKAHETRNLAKAVFSDFTSQPPPFHGTASAAATAEQRRPLGSRPVGRQS